VVRRARADRPEAILGRRTVVEMADLHGAAAATGATSTAGSSLEQRVGPNWLTTLVGDDDSWCDNDGLRWTREVVVVVGKGASSGRKKASNTSFRVSDGSTRSNELDRWSRLLRVLCTVRLNDCGSSWLELLVALGTVAVLCTDTDKSNGSLSLGSVLADRERDTTWLRRLLERCGGGASLGMGDAARLGMDGSGGVGGVGGVVLGDRSL
jgi:hypothetical protein